MLTRARGQASDICAHVYNRQQAWAYIVHMHEFTVDMFGIDVGIMFVLCVLTCMQKSKDMHMTPWIIHIMPSRNVHGKQRHSSRTYGWQQRRTSSVYIRLARRGQVMYTPMQLQPCIRWTKSTHSMQKASIISNSNSLQQLRYCVVSWRECASLESASSYLDTC